MSAEFTVKWKIGDQLRRFTVTPESGESALAALHRHMTTIVGPGAGVPHITYEDEEADVITISSDAELAEAIRCFQASGYAYIRLNSPVAPIQEESAPPKLEQMEPTASAATASEEVAPTEVVQSDTPQTPRQPEVDTPRTGALHPNVICDCCDSIVVGHRYRCIMCADYDLCQQCESTGLHSHHAMLRIVDPQTTMVPWGARLRSSYGMRRNPYVRHHHERNNDPLFGQTTAGNTNVHRDRMTDKKEQFKDSMKRGIEMLSTYGQVVTNALANMGIEATSEVQMDGITVADTRYPAPPPSAPAGPQPTAPSAPSTTAPTVTTSPVDTTNQPSATATTTAAAVPSAPPASAAPSGRYTVSDAVLLNNEELNHLRAVQLELESRKKRAAPAVVKKEKESKDKGMKEAVAGLAISTKKDMSTPYDGMFAEADRLARQRRQGQPAAFTDNRKELTKEDAQKQKASIASVKPYTDDFFRREPRRGREAGRNWPDRSPPRGPVDDRASRNRAANDERPSRDGFGSFGPFGRSCDLGGGFYGDGLFGAVGNRGDIRSDGVRRSDTGRGFGGSRFGSGACLGFGGSGFGSGSGFDTRPTDSGFGGGFGTRPTYAGFGGGGFRDTRDERDIDVSDEEELFGDYGSSRFSSGRGGRGRAFDTDGWRDFWGGNKSSSALPNDANRRKEQQQQGRPMTSGKVTKESKENKAADAMIQKHQKMAARELMKKMRKEKQREMEKGEPEDSQKEKTEDSKEQKNPEAQPVSVYFEDQLQLSHEPESAFCQWDQRPQTATVTAQPVTDCSQKPQLSTEEREVFEQLIQQEDQEMEAAFKKYEEEKERMEQEKPGVVAHVLQERRMPPRDMYYERTDNNDTEHRETEESNRDLYNSAIKMLSACDTSVHPHPAEPFGVVTVRDQEEDMTVPIESVERARHESMGSDIVPVSAIDSDGWEDAADAALEAISLHSSQFGGLSDRNRGSMMAAAPSGPTMNEQTVDIPAQQSSTSSIYPPLSVMNFFGSHAGPSDVPDPNVIRKQDLIGQLLVMGFSEPQSKRAIAHCGCDLESCIDYLTTISD